MNKCENCRFWQPNTGQETDNKGPLFQCLSLSVSFKNERYPVDQQIAVDIEITPDDENFYEIYTGKNFGCINFLPIE